MTIAGFFAVLGGLDKFQHLPWDVSFLWLQLVSGLKPLVLLKNLPCPPTFCFMCDVTIMIIASLSIDAFHCKYFFPNQVIFVFFLLFRECASMAAFGERRGEHKLNIFRCMLFFRDLCLYNVLWCCGGGLC